MVPQDNSLRRSLHIPSEAMVLLLLMRPLTPDQTKQLISPLISFLEKEQACTLCIKIHPQESEKKYREILSPYEERIKTIEALTAETDFSSDRAIFIIKNADLEMLIESADYCISPYSRSILTALERGKTSILVNPTNTPPPFQALTNQEHCSAGENGFFTRLYREMLQVDPDSIYGTEYTAPSASSLFLEEIDIMATFRCNIGCNKCWQRHHIDPSAFQPELTGPEIDKLLDQSDMIANARNLALTGGEPFLNPHLFEICQSLVRYQRPFRLFTNGSFPEQLKKTLEIDGIGGVLSCVHLSIDGPESVHDKMRQPGSFNNVLRCLEYARKHGIWIHANTVITDDNVDYLEETKNVLQENSDSYTFYPHLVNLEYNVKHEYLPRIKPFLTPATYELVESNVLSGTVNTRCRVGSNRCVINPDGSIIACNASMFFGEGFYMGRLREEDFDFDRIWDSDRAKRARELVANCRGCASFTEI